MEITSYRCSDLRVYYWITEERVSYQTGGTRKLKIGKGVDTEIAIDVSEIPFRFQTYFTYILRYRNLTSLIRIHHHI